MRALDLLPLELGIARRPRRTTHLDLERPSLGLGQRLLLASVVVAPTGASRPGVARLRPPPVGRPDPLRFDPRRLCRAPLFESLRRPWTDRTLGRRSSAPSRRSAARAGRSSTRIRARRRRLPGLPAGASPCHVGAVRSRRPTAAGRPTGARKGRGGRSTWVAMLRPNDETGDRRRMRREGAQRAENAENAPPANPVGAFPDRNPATSYSPRGSLPKYHRR